MRHLKSEVVIDLARDAKAVAEWIGAEDPGIQVGIFQALLSSEASAVVANIHAQAGLEAARKSPIPVDDSGGGV